MYTENATGHWLGANYVKDFLGVSKSQAPMNIRGSLWNGIDGKIFDTRNADQNIELGTLVLKKISQAIDSPSVAKIGTLWNATAKDKVSDFGARVEYNYRNRCWEVPEKPNI